MMRTTRHFAVPVIRRGCIEARTILSSATSEIYAHARRAEQRDGTGRCKWTLSGAGFRGGDVLAVGDRVGEGAVVSPELCDLPPQLLLVLGQQHHPLREGGVAVCAEVGVVAHLCDGHSGLSEPTEEPDPFDVAGLVAALSSGGSSDGLDEVGAFVVAQGVTADAGGLGHLRHRQPDRLRRLGCDVVVEHADDPNLECTRSLVRDLQEVW
jgi:hypothetical protein